MKIVYTHEKGGSVWCKNTHPAAVPNAPAEAQAVHGRLPVFVATQAAGHSEHLDVIHDAVGGIEDHYHLHLSAPQPNHAPQGSHAAQGSTNKAPQT